MPTLGTDAVLAFRMPDFHQCHQTGDTRPPQCLKNCTSDTRVRVDRMTTTVESCVLYYTHMRHRAAVGPYRSSTPHRTVSTEGRHMPGHPQRVGLLVFDDMKLLDLVGPTEVFARLIISERTTNQRGLDRVRDVRTSMGLRIPGLGSRGGASTRPVDGGEAPRERSRLQLECAAVEMSNELRRRRCARCVVRQERVSRGESANLHGPAPGPGSRGDAAASRHENWRRRPTGSWMCKWDAANMVAIFWRPRRGRGRMFTLTGRQRGGPWSCTRTASGSAGRGHDRLVVLATAVTIAYGSTHRADLVPCRRDGLASWRRHASSSARCRLGFDRIEDLCVESDGAER